MTLAALRWTLLASTLAACSQTEPPPVPAFETVTVDFRETSSQLVPLPARKPLGLASAPAGSHESTVVAAAPAALGEHGIVSPEPIGPNEPVGASSQTAPSPKYASVTRYFKRWLPDFNKITDCPNGITCQAAFAN